MNFERKTLDGLPVFKENPFDGKTDAPVFEYAFLIGNESASTNFRQIKAVAVLGASLDGKTIYAVDIENSVLVNNTITAINPKYEPCEGIDFQTVSSYIPIPQPKPNL